MSDCTHDDISSVGDCMNCGAFIPWYDRRGHALTSRLTVKPNDQMHPSDHLRFEDHIDEDFMLDAVELTETETLGLHIQTLTYEVSALRDRVLQHLDRMKYYKEPTTEEDLTFLLSEMQRILRDLA